jgi:hypothetical protein
MNLNWLWLDINAMACLLIAVRLLVCRQRGKHRFFSLVAYVLILACGWTTFRIMCGNYIQPDPAECFINVALCVAVWRTKGNLARTAGGFNG